VYDFNQKHDGGGVAEAKNRVEGEFTEWKDGVGINLAGFFFKGKSEKERRGIAKKTGPAEHSKRGGMQVPRVRGEYAACIGSYFPQSKMGVVRKRKRMKLASGIGGPVQDKMSRSQPFFRSISDEKKCGRSTGLT